MKTRFLTLLFGLLLATGALAEWRTESYLLKPGWNAIYPSVDASYVTLDQLLTAYPGVVEVWRWQPERVDPRLPNDVTVPPSGREWAIWRRGKAEETTFTSLTANYGYLVLLDGQANITLTVKGRAALPEVRWRGDALHLAGFPVVTTGTTPTFSTYLAATGFAVGSAPILRYNGGPIANGSNPIAAVPTINRIERGQAYWIRINNFSRYYGPLKVEIDAGTRVDFGTRSGEVKVLLTNLTTNSLTLTLAPAASDSAPSGQSAVAGSVPLKVKVDAETDYSPFSSRSITLDAGAIMPVKFSVDRTAMSGGAGTHYASLLQLTTTGGVAGEQVFVPVTADVGSVAGLWIGEAEITNVGSIAIRYERDASGNTVYDANGRPKVIEDLTTPQNGGTLPGVKKPYPLRLILHVNASGQATLLSHVFQGKLATAPPAAPIGIVTSEALLDKDSLRDAVRLSVANLPLDTESPLGGTFTTGSTLTSGVITNGYNRADNPFLHVYHPDHDNLDARFKTLLPAGKESFDLKRSITFTLDSIAPSGSATSWGTTTMTGTYAELIEGPYKTPIRVQGIFGLYKVSDIPAITRP
jgi:hypothetical protein